MSSKVYNSCKIIENNQSTSTPHYNIDGETSHLKDDIHKLIDTAFRESLKVGRHKDLFIIMDNLTIDVVNIFCNFLSNLQERLL